MTTPLHVKGQGVFVFNYLNKTTPCVILFLNTDKSNGLRVEFTAEKVLVCELASLKPLIDPENKAGLSTHAGAYYWFSLDAQNQRLYAGVGEARLETAIYSYKFPSSSRTSYENTKLFLESLTAVYYECALRPNESTIQPIRVIKDPITMKIPLVVKHTEELTMEHIASASHMPLANLPSINQKLYNCIAGKKFTLNTPDFPDFAAAIEHSIRTPGLWCYSKLRDKSREFNPDKPNLLETYLRITLGQNNGESPGIPYVMEIWPVGHYSPIHSHANASAIIRVLNGEINVSLFPFLCTEKDGVAPFGKVDFKQDEIAWITPTLNQVHQLKNLEANPYTCITIQCYMYTEKDARHYDYFDYLDADGAKQQYEPDSDMDYLDFKQLMKNEWAAASVPVVGAKSWCC